MAGTKRSRKSTTHPAATTPPATKKWTPPSGSWEDEIGTIDACEEEGSGKLVVYLNWKNGQKTKHETAIIYKKCPQKVCGHGWRGGRIDIYRLADLLFQMLQFYEKHVRYVREEKKQAEADAQSP